MLSLMNVVAIRVPSNVDFLLITRGIAAVSVLYWHLGGYIARDEFWASFFIIPGRLAVWIFFMMSGYLIGYGLITGKYETSMHGIKRFYINRLLRIYPLFFVVSVVAVLIHASDITINISFLLKNLFMIQWDHHYPLNSVFWTLGIEMQLYLVAPLLIFMYRSMFYADVKWYGFYVCALLILWGYSFSPFFVNWDLRNIMGGLTHFVVGFVMAGYVRKIPNVISNSAQVIVAIASSTLLMIAVFNHFYSISIYSIIFSHLIGVGLITLHIIIENKKISTNSGVVFLHQLGVLSYGIYAWHGFLLVNEWLVSNFFMHFLATLLLAYMTYQIVERPLLLLKR